MHTNGACLKRQLSSLHAQPLRADMYESRPRGPTVHFRSLVEVLSNQQSLISVSLFLNICLFLKIYYQ